MELSLVRNKSSKLIAKCNNVNVYINETDKIYDKRCRSLSTDGKFTLVPSIEKGQRLAVYISGVSGSGKSTACANYIKDLLKIPQFSKYPVYMLTWSKIADSAFKDIESFTSVNIRDPNYLDLDITMFAKSIVVFDDWTTISDKDIEKKTISLVNELLENSRKQSTIIFVINHQTQNYSKTKNIIFECSQYVLFPTYNYNATVKFLRSYLDIDKEIEEKIKRFTSRVIYVNKIAPRYLISDNEILLL